MAIAASAASPSRRRPPAHARGLRRRQPARRARRRWRRALRGSTASRSGATFGASGLLKDRILAGESPQVFASANMGHPQRSSPRDGCARSRPSRATRCACWRALVLAAGQVARAAAARCRREAGHVDAQGRSLGRLCVRYVRAHRGSGAAGPGSAAASKAKALQLTGGPESPPPPRGRTSTASWSPRASRCLHHLLHQRDRGAPRARRLQVLAVPAAINVCARYGLALLEPAGADAQAYAQFLSDRRGRRSSRCTASWRRDGRPAGSARLRAGEAPPGQGLRQRQHLARPRAARSPAGSRGLPPRPARRAPRAGVDRGANRASGFRQTRK